MSWLNRLWDRVSAELFVAPKAAAILPAAAPVVWLLGKTGAGKTSIVAALTGDTRAEIGPGFRPCTRTAAFYDLPPEAPLLRFLDTRGLEESDYDADADLTWSEGQSHLLLAVMRVNDLAQDAVVRVLKAVRHRHPGWGLIVAQTALHTLYPPNVPHPPAYPYTGGAEDEINPALPHPLRQALAYQRRQLDSLPGPRPIFVPLDFTDADDLYLPAAFGIDALLTAMATAGADAAAALRRVAIARDIDRVHAGSQRLVLGCATAAAVSGAVPVPAVGIGGVASAVAVMLRGMGERYGVQWTRANFARFTGAIGIGGLAWLGVRFGVVELAKLVPVAGSILGGTLNAAAAFSIVYGTAEAARVWLRYQSTGTVAPTDEVRRAFLTGLREGLRRHRDERRRA